MNISTIIEEKAAAGDTAYLWLHASGDCILWASESDSIDDDGSAAIGRWQLNNEEANSLEKTGMVDGLA